MEDAAYRPRMKAGHLYRTTTKFMRNPDGSFMHDEEGYPVPEPHAKDVLSVKRVSTPEERAQGRQRSRKKATIEKRAITRMRNKIDKRQNIGDPDCVQSRDEDFPLLAVLRRDKAHSMIVAVMAYRALVALCESEPMKGQQYGQSSGMSQEYETRKMIGVDEVDAAAAEGFKDTSVPCTDVVYERRVRKSEGAYNIPAKRRLAAEVSDDGTPIGGRTESLHIKINEDTIADYIDSKPRLAQIRSALGPLLEPVDDAVLGGQTLKSIGEREGFTGVHANSAGNALVMRGIAVLDGFLGQGVRVKKLTADNDNSLKMNVFAA